MIMPVYVVTVIAVSAVFYRYGGAAGEPRSSADHRRRLQMGRTGTQLGHEHFLDIGFEGEAVLERKWTWDSFAPEIRDFVNGK